MDNNSASSALNGTAAKPKPKRRSSKIRPTKGSVREKNSAWYWEYYVESKHKMERLGSTKDGDPDYLRSKQAAVDEANKRHNQRGSTNTQKNAPRTGSILVTEFAKNVFLPWVKEERRPATYRGYRQIWDQHLESHFDQRRLYDYQPYMATEFLSGLARAGKHGKNTISHVRALMSGIFEHAISLGHLQWNPIAGAKLLSEPKKKPAETQHYSTAEMIATLRALDTDEHARDHAIMSLCFFGVCRAEIMGAKWDDVDWLAGSLYIQRSAWMGQVADGAKNKKRVRKVWLGDIAMRSLRRWKSVSVTTNGFIFPNEARKPLDLGLYSTRVMRPKFDKLGLIWKAFHSGRRSSVTEMRRFGKPETIAFQHGHSIEVANDVYDKGREDETRKAALEYDAELSARLSDVKNGAADNSGQSVQ
jgi:integrase